MPITIRDISSDKRIELRNGRIARRPAVMAESSWQRLRVGIRFTIEDVGVNLSSLLWDIGLCTGYTYIPGDPTIPSVEGHSWSAVSVNTGNTLVRSVAPIKYAWTFSVAQVHVDGVLTSQSVDMEPSTSYIFCSSTSRAVLFFDFVQGGTTVLFRNTASAGADVSKETFDAQMVAETPVIAGHALSASTGSVTVDQAANGVFTHAFMRWNQWTALYISDFAVARIY